MKKTLSVQSKNKNYNIIVENNSLLKYILMQESSQKIIIIIDSKLSFLLNKLKLNNNYHIIKINGGEKIKSFKNYSLLCSKILKLKINRSSCIIAIGGGTIGDLVGFVASTLLRGIKFILMPTTLLSQVDSSIGGKNGINATYGKNLVGTFYQPNKVFIDPSLLRSLNKREIKSGYAEILKHALIKDKNFYKWLCKNYTNVLNLKKYYITKAIIHSIKIKTFFIQKDEHEKLQTSNSRAMLNFGHTFGHALETMNNYNNKLTHGEAIAIGMSLASKISYKKKLITDKEYYSIIRHLKAIKLPYKDKRIKQDKLYKLMLADKKNTNNKINLILLKKIGNAVFEKGLNKEDIKNILN